MMRKQAHLRKRDRRNTLAHRNTRARRRRQVHLKKRDRLNMPVHRNMLGRLRKQVRPRMRGRPRVKNRRTRKNRPKKKPLRMMMKTTVRVRPTMPAHLNMLVHPREQVRLKALVVLRI
jgi:hypothetical protein